MKNKNQYVVNLAQIKALRPCESSFKEFVRYMGGPKKLAAKGDFSIVEIVSHNPDHAHWVMGELGFNYGEQSQLLDAWRESLNARSVIDARVAATNKALGIRLPKPKVKGVQKRK